MQNTSADKNGQKLAYRLKQFKDKAEKVDARDISIFLRKIIERKSFDLATLENFEDLAGNLFELILKNKKSVCVVKSSDPTDEAIKNSGKLRTLYRTTNFIQDETGQYTLFLGFPFIEGFLQDNLTYIRAPLVLFPVTLELEKTKKPTGWHIHEDQERTPTVNKALFSFLKSKGYAEFPENLEDKFTELFEKISDTDLPDFQSKFIVGLYDVLDSFSFRYNKDLQDKTESLAAIKKDDMANLEKNGLHIKNSVVLGIFQQGNSAISADYDMLITKALNGYGEQGIIDDLLEAPSEENQWNSSSSKEAEEIDLDRVPDRELNTILPSDSSQDEVLLASQTQECTVVRGPPGTGKSQVIANLIANALSKNQRVLVVCQKRAALDVVAQRLAKEGLGDYISLIEDSNRDKSTLYRRLSRFLESEVSRYEAIQNTMDVNFTSSDIDKLVEKQSSLVRALSKPYFGGMTIHQLYVSTTTNYTPKLNLRGIADKLTINELDQLLSIIPLIQQSSIKFSVVNHPWFFRKDLSDFSPLEQRQFSENLDKLLVLSEKEMLDMNMQKLTRLDASIHILKTKTGFFSSFNKEKKEAIQFTEDILKRKLEKNENFDQITEKIQSELSLRNGLEILRSVLKDDFINGLKSESLERIKDFVSALKNTLNDITDIQALDSKIRDLNDAQKAIISLCAADFTTHHVPWEQLVKDEVYAHWIDYIQKENTILQGNPFESYIQQKNRLGELLFNKRELLKRKLVAELQLKIRSIPKYKRKSPDEIRWSKFTSDVGKQRKLKPLRRLFEEYREILLSIAPCWLMTPQAVSEVFPLERGLFDLIVYDEASQCPVEESIPSLYRGKRVVIAGDEKQLRPFDLFRMKDETDEQDEDEPISSESLFILAKRFYNFRPLNWHYRSKSQDLIDFSNHAFYEGRLQVVPDVIRNPKTIPIRWINVNGTWQNNINSVEAVRVVDEIKNILQQNMARNPPPSVGVITFNEKQQIAIQDEIDKRRSEDPEFDQAYSLAKNPLSKKKDDEIFIKNIENVQGDERDIIIFSIAYAKDLEGKFRMLFGTLNQEGGENRLNVAVTRAREEIVVVASIDPIEIKPDEKKNSGRQRLKEYLEYAKAVSESNKDRKEQILLSLSDGANRTSDSFKIFDSKFEEMVYDKLASHGFAIDTQVGLSGYRIDLAVVHPQDTSRYILGIECDGANFHSAKSTRERDVMRQEFLEGRGWKIERIWSTNWWKDPQKEINRIISRIDEIQKITN